LKLPRIGVGAAPLGGLYSEVTDDEATAAVHRAWNLGLRLFDTAPHYGAGLSEQRLGRAIAELPRADLVLCSKAGRVLVPGAEPGYADFFKGAPAMHPEFDFSADGIRRSVESSLERLGVDRLDIVHIHDPDDHGEQALRESLPALAQLKAEGTVGAVGAGMNQVEMLTRFALEGDFDCFLVAGRYSLLDQSAARELLPACLDRGIDVIVGGVFNSGILANPIAGARYDYEPASDALLARAQQLKAVCARHGVPLRAAAVQFALGHPAVTTVLVGVRSAAELEDNNAMFRRPIPADLWDELAADGMIDPRGRADG
jgi:D-threo-aldose 1-dehydrogenase